MLSIFLNSLFLLSHLFSPLFKPKQYPPPNINITHQSSSFFLVGCDPGHVLCSGFFFFCCDRCLKEEVGMAGFLGCSDWWWVWWRSAWVTGFGGDRPLWVTGFGGARCGSLGLVEIGALLLPSLPGKAEILSSNLLALPLRIAKGLPHPKSLSYIGNLDKLPVVIIALSKFPNGKSLGSLSQSFTPWCTVSLLCATTFLCRLTGFGLDQRGSASWVWIVGLGSVDGGFGLVDRWVWNGGSVNRWVDRLGWSSVAPMVAPMMIFGYFRRPGFQIGSVDGSVCVCVCGSVDGSVGSVR